MKVIGFTGTQEGMNPDQLRFVEELLQCATKGLGLREVHHGDCIGADAQFHGLVEKLMESGPKIHTVGHPANIPGKRAYCNVNMSYPPKPPLVRNRDIVKCARDFLIATPKEESEIVRSGTWSTIRLARQFKLDVHLVLPSIGSWRPICSAPKDASQLVVQMSNGLVQIAHWAEDLSGSEQPVFQGWFVERPSFMEEIDTPKYWREPTELDKDLPGMLDSRRVFR